MQHSALVPKPAEAQEAIGIRTRHYAHVPAEQTASLRTQETPGAGRMPWSFSRVSVQASQPALVVGSDSDPLEAAAQHAASTPGKASIGGAREPGSARPAPDTVPEALASPGRSLDPASRRGFEARYRHDFSRVRLHSDATAARSAEALGARAFTVGDHIVLGRGSSDHGLLAHELAHVVQQSAASIPWVQCQGVTGGTPAPRKDFVFLMGEDQQATGNPFFAQASKYFKAHLPTATMVEDKRTLKDMLDWISSNVSAPIGNLYIVSHGAEDGTLGFGLDSPGDMTVMDLRKELHPSGGGKSSLPSVSTLIDGQTRIHIKGCDIGRTQEMVELIDEAFGGSGTVIAPTHEQEYTTDSQRGTDARKAAHDKDVADFTAKLPALPPKAAPVDPALKDDALKAAKLQHDTDAAARKTAEDAQKAAIAAEEIRIKPQLDKVEAEASTVDALSGPMFQRPGNTRFTAAEIQPQVDALYGHLSEAQRKSLTARLVAPDSGGPHDQRGQKVDHITPFTTDYNEAASLAEAKVVYQQQFKDANNFEAKTMTVGTPTPVTGGNDVTYTFSGTEHPQGGDPVEKKWVYTETVPDDKSALAEARAQTNNPARYQWRVDRNHGRNGVTKLTVVGERVIAYLHHGSLDAAAHDHFGKPESDANFYTSSTLTPPPPPPAKSGTGNP